MKEVLGGRRGGGRGVTKGSNVNILGNKFWEFFLIDVFNIAD